MVTYKISHLKNIIIYLLYNNAIEYRGKYHGFRFLTSHFVFTMFLKLSQQLSYKTERTIVSH